MVKSQVEAAFDAAARRVDNLSDDKEWLRAVGRRLRIAARAKRLSQRDLAELVGLTQGSISHWFNGEHAMHLTVLRALAAALDQPLAWLLDEVPLGERSIEETVSDLERRIIRLEAVCFDRENDHEPA